MREGEQMKIDQYSFYESNGLKQLLKHESRSNAIERMEAVKEHSIKALLDRDKKVCIDCLDDMLPYFLGLLGDLKRGRG